MTEEERELAADEALLSTDEARLEAEAPADAPPDVAAAETLELRDRDTLASEDERDEREALPADVIDEMTEVASRVVERSDTVASKLVAVTMDDCAAA